MQKTSPPSPTHASALADLQRQQLLLRMEYEYEKEEFRRQTEVMGVARKVKRGLCWFPAKAGRSYYNSLGNLVVEISRSEDLDIEHNFEYGRPVCFFTLDASGLLHYFSFTGTVSYATDESMVVMLPGAGALASLQQAERLGVQLYFDETSYRVQFEALADVIRAKGSRLETLRETLLGPLPPTWRASSNLRFPWLNPTQEAAVDLVMRAKEAAVVHGPPGTGKTTTLVEAIGETLRRENQVLVCAQSNMAVDWISEQLTDRGISVLRIGNPTRVNDKMLSFTYERRFEAHPDYPELWSIRKAIRELQQRRRDRRSADWHDRLASLRDRATELEIRINEALFAEARVVACTLIGSAHRTLQGRHFPTLFIDEAAQALEAACWAAIRKADRVILAGDHQQLPPTIQCIEAARGGLDRTLMQKLAQQKPTCVSLLQVQYRMHADIMRFSSDWFYHGELKAAPEVSRRNILEWDVPMEWHDTADLDAPEEFVGEHFGRINKPEAERLVALLHSYVERIGMHRLLDERIDFGVISPYRAQVQYLRQLIKADAFLRPLRSLISINTVDGFQGQERDVVLISLVRANAEGQIGFLSDLRRMNVAITRARMKVIVAGHVATLTRHPFYRKLYEYIQSLHQEQPAD
ncbi:MAG: AAA domain-containing protein [Bacteroidaceae bacterium]